MHEVKLKQVRWEKEWMSRNLPKSDYESASCVEE